MNKALVTGGAGFIGSNLVTQLLRNNWKVILFDNLSRGGTKENLNWIKKSANKGSLTIVIDDVRREKQVERHVEKVDVVFHLAAQVAVTNSLSDPKKDFDINARGTLNVLEAARRAKQKPLVLYSSTNKVYGSLESVKYKEGKTRYICQTYPKGINEENRLDFHTPYACSKGAADQYVRDYKRVYGLNTVVFRQSCIYGPRQFGIIEQGWMAYLAASAILAKPITFFGNGKQARDALFIDDLISAFLLAVEKRRLVSGQVYNIGGGVDNSVSLIEYTDKLERVLGKKIEIKSDKWRLGDQKVFISDNSKIEKELGWHPKTSIDDGLIILVKWISDNISLFR